MLILSKRVNDLQDALGLMSSEGSRISSKAGNEADGLMGMVGFSCSDFSSEARIALKCLVENRCSAFTG